jgi:hypothetical protein
MAYFHNFSELARPVLGRRWEAEMLPKSDIGMADDPVLSYPSSDEEDCGAAPWSPTLASYV